MTTYMRYWYLMLVLLSGMLVAPVAAVSAASGAPESGEFVITDFTPTSATPVHQRCLLEGEIALDFTGALAGAASGSIRVLVHAPCSEATANPPGTFRDKFAATLAFSGNIVGQPEDAAIIYTGHTQPGGATNGMMQVDGEHGTHSVLRVEAQAGVGGTYSGPIITK